MNTHMPTQASRPASASPLFISTPQHHYAAQSGTSFPYANSIYPTLPIPRPSSSSLATALDPHPECNPKNTPIISSQLVNTVSSVNQLGVQVTGALAEAAGTNNPTSQVDMSSRYARQFSNYNGSFRAQHQMFQEPNPQRHVLNQGQSPSHYAYSPTQSSSSSSSTSYTPSQQNEAYVTFSAYPGNLPLPSITPPVVPGTPQLPIFSHEYSFNPAGISGDEFDTNGGWNYAQSSSSFQASQGLYMGLDNADTNIAAGHDASAWLDTSFDSQSQPQSTPGEMFGSPVDPNYSAASTSGSMDSGYFGADQSRQRLPLEQDNFSAAQDRHQPIAQACPESQEYFINAASQQSSSSQHSTPPSIDSASVVTQANNNGCESEEPRRPWGHNALMPPPPLPARANTLGMDRSQPDSRPSQSRRHTVAVPPPRDEASRNEGTSIEPPLASASTRPSSTAPGSSSSSSLHEDSSTVDGLAATPRLATLSLNDSQWMLANECNRQALVESYRTSHGPRDVPDKLLKETSALERSKRLDGVLLDFKESKDAQTRNDQSTGADTPSRGNNGTSVLITSAESEKVAEEEFFRVSEPGWVPALPGYEIERAFASQGHGNAESPMSPTTTEELVAPDGTVVPPVNHGDSMPYAYATPANPDATVKALSSTSLRNIMAVMRHDGHLAPYVSGLGGGFHNAYDGRSYLTDDSEDDPEHVPPAPPGARSGDHPALAAFLPHPLLKRGQKWHDLTNPRPSTSSTKGLLPNQKEPGNVIGNDSAEKDANEEEQEALKTLEKEGVKKEEQGEGWGYVEAGSHGPQFALPGTDKTAPGSRRLKLSTEKKTPPKMACHFCRNRKIACGASKCGDPTICNQCERRNIRCIFPTISRRGMRTRNQRSAHTVDGTDEADKDSVEHEGSPGRTDIQMVPHNPMEGSSGASIRKTSKTRKQAEKGIKDKETTKGKGRGRGRKKADASDDSQEGLSRRTIEDVEMEGSDHASGSSTQVDRVITAVYADDPLASLAADMQWSNRDQQSLPSPSLQFNSRPPTAFSPPSSISSSSLSTALHFPPDSFDISYTVPNSNDTYSFDVEPSPVPFTSNPLQRRN